MASDASLDTSLLASEKRYKTQLGHPKAVAVAMPECEETAAKGIPSDKILSCGKRKKVTSQMVATAEMSKLSEMPPGPFEAFDYETACATPVQADIFVPELQHQRPTAQPSIPKDIAALQAAPADRALPKDQLNPSFHDPLQPSLVVVTPDQLFERPVCDSQQAGTHVIMQQPDSSLTNQVQSGTSHASADDSPAVARPTVFADGSAAAIPGNDGNVLVASTDRPCVSSISKPPEAAQIKGSPATQAAAAAATASQQQSPPAEPAAAMASEQHSPPAEPAAAMASEQQSPPAEPAAAMASEQQSSPAEPTDTGLMYSEHANSAFGSSAKPTSSKLCGASPTGIAAIADKPVSSQGDLVGTLLGPLATTEAALVAYGPAHVVAQIAGNIDEVHGVEVDTNDVCTISSCALSEQACGDAPQTSSDPVPERGLPAASDRSITTLKYSPVHAPASPNIRSTSGSSMTESAAAFSRGGEAEQVVPYLSCSSQDASTSHAPAGIRPDTQPHVSAATEQQELSGLAVHGQYVTGSGTARATSVGQGNAAQRLSSAAEPQQPTAADDGDALTDIEEILPVKPFPEGMRQRLMLATRPVACLKKQLLGRAAHVVIDLTQD